MAATLAAFGPLAGPAHACRTGRPDGTPPVDDGAASPAATLAQRDVPGPARPTPARPATKVAAPDVFRETPSPLAETGPPIGTLVTSVVGPVGLGRVQASSETTTRPAFGVPTQGDDVPSPGGLPRSRGPGLVVRLVAATGRPVTSGLLNATVVPTRVAGLVFGPGPRPVGVTLSFATTRAEITLTILAAGRPPTGVALPFPVGPSGASGRPPAPFAPPQKTASCFVDRVARPRDTPAAVPLHFPL